MSHLTQVNRTLTPEQLTKVEGFAKECPSPLYIKMVVDLCFKVNSYHKVPVILKSNLHFQPGSNTMHRIYQQQSKGLLIRFLQNWSVTTVKLWLAMLWDESL